MAAVSVMLGLGAACGDNSVTASSPDAAMMSTGSGEIGIGDNDSADPRAHGTIAYALLMTPMSCGIRTEVAGCEVFHSTCFGPQPLRNVSAGTIHFDGTTAPVMLVPDGSGAYATSDSTDLLFTPGSTISISTTGAEIPPLSGTVVTPTKVTVTSVGGVMGRPESVDRTHDIVVTWIGGTTGDVEVGFSQGIDSLDAVDCRLPAGPGTGVVPAEALAELQSGGAELGIFAESLLMVDAGGWTVKLDASVEAVYPDNSRALSSVIFQ